MSAYLYDGGMFIRCTKKPNGNKNYYCYQLVESVRTEKGPRQHIIITLGSELSLDKPQRKQLANRIEEILTGVQTLFDLPPHIESLAQEWADKLAQKQLADSSRNSTNALAHAQPDYQQIDANSLSHEQARQAGVETIAYHMITKLGLPAKLTELGLTPRQSQLAVGVVVHRLANPGSELFAHKWLREISALDELIGCSFQSLSKNSIYKAGDLLFESKKEIEKFLADQQETLFDCKSTVYLYDLTNTYFEGQGGSHTGAKHGVSKEKRKDCPLVTLGLVINQAGFAKRSRIYAGNVSESSTLQRVVDDLSVHGCDSILVMDAGLSTEENRQWLQEKKIPYITVTKHRQPIDLGSEPVTFESKSGQRISVRLKTNAETQEAELHCHSEAREKKEKAIEAKLRERFEEQLKLAHAALSKKGGIKKYEKVFERIGRLKERHRGIASYYDVEVIKDSTKSENAGKIRWAYQPERARKKFEGGYILKAYNVGLAAEELWRVYTQLTQVEDAFRNLKSDLGLRPIYHQLEKRIDAHLFITTLAYHVLHAIRHELGQQNITASWESIRRTMVTQIRVTTAMRTKDSGLLRVRSTSKPTAAQREIYRALGISFDAKPVKTLS